MAWLRLGAFALEVDDGLVALAAPRVDVTAFRMPLSRPWGTLRLVQGPPDGGGVSLGEGSGSYRVDGDTVRAWAEPWSPRAAEAALKALFALAALRQQGLLVHGAAVAFAGGAAVVLGPSGAGKSTFARLLVEAGGTLLSDESVVLARNGEVWATPFHSDFDAPRGPLEAKLRALLTLRKAPQETLRELPDAALVETVLAQAYRPPPGAIAPAGLLELAARRVAAAGARAEYAFRIHPEVGKTWSERLA